MKNRLKTDLHLSNFSRTYNAFRWRMLSSKEHKILINCKALIFCLLKVLYYPQNEEIWVIVLQNSCMFAKNYHLHWLAGRAKILSKYIFFNFGRDFCGSLPVLLPKAPAFCCIVLLYIWAQKVSQIFKNLISNWRY